MTAIFPTLPGLAFSTTKTPTWNTSITKRSSGRRRAIGRYVNPIWKFQLIFEVLRDGNGFDELRRLAGFYLQQRGPLVPFWYSDPDDNSVSGQVIGYGDGVTTAFTFVRTFGAFVEPVGQVQAGFTVYLNGVRQAAGFGLSGANTLQFGAAPAAGTLISADFSYYFLCVFSDDSMDFEKFMDRLWDAKKVNLESTRGT